MAAIFDGLSTKLQYSADMINVDVSIGWTMSVMYKSNGGLDGYAGFQAIWDKRDVGKPDENRLEITGDANANPSRLTYQYLGPVGTVGYTAGSLDYTSIVSNLDDNQWHVFIVTYTPDRSFVIYLDGTVLNSGDALDPITSSTSVHKFNVGDSNTLSRKLNGNLAEMAQWNTTLDANTIDKLSTGSFPSHFSTNRVWYLPFSFDGNDVDSNGYAPITETNMFYNGSHPIDTFPIISIVSSSPACSFSNTYKSINNIYSDAIATLNTSKSYYYEAAEEVLLLDDFDPEIDLLKNFYSSYLSASSLLDSFGISVSNAIRALQNHILRKHRDFFGNAFNSVNEYIDAGGTFGTSGGGKGRKLDCDTSFQVQKEFAQISQASGYVIDEVLILN